MIIEIPMNADPIKYEVDKDTGALFVDRFMTTAMHYPCNYGYIPQTLADDGDPVDVLVITPVPLIPGVVVTCRPIGVLKMDDEAGGDAKLLAVPIDKILSIYTHWQKPDDINPMRLKTIQHFFEHYKDLEPGKWVKVSGWEGPEAARAEVATGMAAWATKQRNSKRNAGALRTPSVPSHRLLRRMPRRPRAFACLHCGARCSRWPPAGVSMRIVQRPRGRLVCRAGRRCAAGAAQAGGRGRRHHRVPAGQRPAGAAGARRLQADDDGQPDLPRRLAPRELRRDRHGAPARAPAVQGLADASARCWAEFTKRGLRANGTTWFDRTNYFASFAANDDNLNWYLGWQADAMVNSFIARKDLDTEMTVVRNEMETGENDPERILFEQTLATMYHWHNYGKIDDRRAQRRRERRHPAPAGLLPHRTTSPTTRR